MSKISGSLRPTMSPLQFNTHIWEGKEDGGEATWKTSTTDPNPQAPGGSV